MAEAGTSPCQTAGPPADQAVVALQPRLLVVQQRLERADVEDGQPVPGLGQGLGEQREEGRLGLAAGGRGQDEQVGPVQDARRWPAPAPAAATRQPRELTTWCCRAGWSRSKAAMSQVQLDVVDRRRPAAARSTRGQLAVGDRQAVVPPRVEVGELVDPVEHVGDELLEEQPRGDADLAARASPATARASSAT